MAQPHRDNIPSETSYYERKNAPPLDGCVGLLLAFIILVVLGVVSGGTPSCAQYVVTILALIAGIGILWALERRGGGRWGSYVHLTTRSIAWALFILMALMVVSVITRNGRF